MLQDTIVDNQEQTQTECADNQDNILIYAEPNTGYEEIKFSGEKIFSEEKMAELHKMGESLIPLWQRSSETVKPFVCRRKSPDVIISVVIPVYNVETFLTSCLQSVANQTLSNMEIICVDDGSTDRSPEILKFFAAHDERFSIITQANSNAGAARNRALDVVRGKYLYFMDSDDLCLPEMLETAVKIAEEENCETVVWPYITFDSATKEILATKKLSDEIVDIDTVKNLFIYLYPNAWTKIFLTKMVIENDLRFQEITNNNDASFVCTALALSEKIRTISKPMYFYRKSGTGLQATVRRAPYCAVHARIHTKNELVKRGLWTPRYYMHFVNAFYHIMANQLARAPLSLEELITVRDTLREHFDFSMIKCEDIADKEAYQLIQALIFSSDECYLTQLVTTLKNCTQERKRERKREKKKENLYKRQIAKQTQQIAKLKAQIQQIEKSFSYRLGRKLTWLPRKVKRFLQRLKVHFL